MLYFKLIFIFGKAKNIMELKERYCLGVETIKAYLKISEIILEYFMNALQR